MQIYGEKEMKFFVITIDTEGDNLWEWRQGDRVTTENVKYLSRFQSLCDRYGFKPVWLTNYEMISDPLYVDFISKVEDTGTGELGMHLHAWSTPPEYELCVKKTGAPYLIEYPIDIMEQKIATMTEILRDRTGIIPVTHRAGRWAMNAAYFELLKKYGYHIDCSVTPHENWTEHIGSTEGSAGSNYTDSPEEAYWIDSEKTVLEVPLTVRRTHRFFGPEKLTLRRLAGSVKRSVNGENIWLRPGHSGEKQMHFLIDQIVESKSDYLMFMLHSSEFMPGGSPKFKTAESVEGLYGTIERLFRHIARDFEGITLREYYKKRQ